MNRLLRLALAVTAMLPIGLSAQEVDRSKYPDYSSKFNPDPSLMKSAQRAGARATVRPDHINNANTKFFPPVFNQDGGSCGSASRICYMFTHELNSFRDLDGKNPDNYYPSHFVWLLTSGNSGKDEFVQFVGVPNATTYGGQTYSKLFGYQEETDSDFGWMTGYEKWYSAMFNRMLRPSNFPQPVSTEAGREAVKNWLWNHNGDSDFHSGGIVGIGVASGGDWQRIPSTPANDEIGVTNMYYVNKWGKQVDHALTIVGYDDRVEFDLNGNGKFGEASADEKGAWIIVNSWGDGWCNGGFIYCPYKHAVPAFNENGSIPNNYWTPEVYRVRKNYRPLRTIKVKMDYSRRSELFLSAGVSRDLNASEPEISTAFEHFKYAGDGKNGNTVPAPEVPMLGRWADNKMHTEPMEFGYDLTDLSSNFDQNTPLKYFFIIQTKTGAQGVGKVYDASIIDYLLDEYGVETPFNATATEDVTIQNDGKRTVISMVVQGRGVYGPRNAYISAQTLTWDEPLASARKITGYKVYDGKDLIATLSADTKTFTLPTADRKAYSLTALYEDIESDPVKVITPIEPTNQQNYFVNVKKNGFTIPTVFGQKYDKATIEYWINPNTLYNWNQSAGPGWGNFMFHGNQSGALTVGWDTSNGNRMDVEGAYTRNTWRHVAIVVDGNTISVYLNGVFKKKLTSSTYSGIGGFGDLVFTANTANNANTDAKLDELRIWKTARTAEEIQANYSRELGDAGLSDDLLVYYKGDLFNDGGTQKWRDHTTNGRHATFFNDELQEMTTGGPGVAASTEADVTIDIPEQPIYAGIPVTLNAKGSEGAMSLLWNIPEAGITNSRILSPTVTFSTAGTKSVSVTATAKGGATSTATTEVNVLAAPAPDATFTATKTTAPAGERISFHASKPEVGYLYEWQFPGADKETATTAAAGATYQRKGEYQVTLTVIAPNGQTATSSQTISVSEVAPMANFDVNPAVIIKGEATNLIDASKYGPDSWKWQVLSTSNAFVSSDRNVLFNPSEPGIYDVKLSVANSAGSSDAEQKGALIVCNADSKNGLNFAYDGSKVTTTTVPFTDKQNTYTIDWWMRPATLADRGNAIGEQSSTLLMTTSSNGDMQVQMKGNTAHSGAGYVLPGSWHHYALVYQSGSLRFYRDGEFFASTSGMGASMTAPSVFAIGGNANAPFSGQIDEFRVWKKALTQTAIRNYCNQPLEGEALETAKSTYDLRLYYQCNQSSGDLIDASGLGNNGVRSGFGPEGDAWGLSRGVFCLNFTNNTSDITSSYLKNYKEPFAASGAYNPKNPTRFVTLLTWTRENESNVDTPTGAHVDRNKSNNLTITTGYDGFDTSLTDHKLFQTVTLPAGAYRFTASYGNYEGNCGDSYIVAAKGKTLPLTKDLSKEALSYTKMAGKSSSVKENSTFFTLTEETEVSLGLVVNLGNMQCLSFSAFKLEQFPTVDVTGIEEMTTLPEIHKDEPIYDLSGRRVFTPQKGQVYLIGKRKVIIH